MLAHLALAIAPILTPATTPTPHTLTAVAPLEVWARKLGDLLGVAVDADGRVWVTDHAGGRVLRLDAPGSARIVASGLRGPTGIALDDTGRVLVVEEDGDRIVHVTSTGALEVIARGLERPRWLAVGDDGTLYVSAQRLAKSPKGSDAAPPGVVVALRAGAPPTLLAHGLPDPEGLAIHDGALYVATRGRQPAGTDTIVRLPLATAGEEAQGHGGDTLRRPIGVAFDARGVLFATAPRATIAEEPVTGVIVRLHAAASPEVFASGAEEPQGLALDRDGHLYVVERKAGRVVRFLAPRAPTVNAPPAWTNVPDVELTGHAEREARIEAVVGQVTAQAFAGTGGDFSLTLPLAPNAINHVSLRAVGQDGEGLTSPAVAVDVVHDTRPPALSLDVISGGPVAHGMVTLRATATDSGSQLTRVELLAAGHTLASISTPAPPAPLVVAVAGWASASGPDGVHTLVARATDRAGNVTSVTRTITVDNTPPTTEIAGPEGTIDGVRFTARGTDNLTPPAELQFAWRVDGGAWSPFSAASTVTVPGLPPGSHVVEAKARDRAGNEATPAALSFAVSGGTLGLTILEPRAGATLPAGTALVRGTIDRGSAEAGVTVNGLPGWLEGTTFTALAEIDPGSTAIVATAVTADGRTAIASIPIVVAAAPAVSLVAAPWSGIAPLTVRFSLSRDPATASVALDTDADGVTDVAGPGLNEHVAVYTRPGIYVARAVVTDVAGATTIATAVIRVFDPAALDGELRARWSALRDALRRGDVGAGVSHIVQRRRADYEAAFRLLSASLPAIDSILTDLTPVKVRNASAVYEMRRTDDGLPKSFEVRFAIDGDGIWRVEAF